MKLGKYKGIRAKHPNVIVDKKEIDKVLKNKQHENCVVYTVDDRPAKMGNEAVLDYHVECDGKTVPGSSQESYPLLLGSHTFVKGFEEAVVGHAIGDRFDIAVTFPEKYRMANLAGKDAVFHVTLKQLRIPEYQPIDDDFAKDFSEFSTLAEWREQIFQNLRERKEASAYEKLARELLTKIIADSKIPIDPEIKKEITEELYEDFLYSLDENGMTLETYLNRSGMTKKQIRAAKEEEAIRAIREQSVLHAVANAEHLEISPEELADELAELAYEEGEDPDVFTEMLGEEEIESIGDQLRMNKAMEFVLEHAILE